MTVFHTAYDTAACSGFVTKKTSEALQVALINGWLTSEKNIYLVNGQEGISAIPAFAHPLVITNSQNQKCVVLDVRPYGGWNAQKQEFFIRNTIEYALALHRAQLTRLWLTDCPSLLRNISPVPMSVFASWISEALARRFALDPRQQLDLAIVSAVFYNSLFEEQTTAELSEADKLRLANAISRALRASTEDVLAIVDKVSVLPDVKAFCTYVASHTEWVRLRELNVGLLFAILGGTWFTNSKETIAVALEHPPTWIAIVMAALVERTFKNSAIAKITERGTYRDTGKDFLRAVLNLVQTTTNY